MDMKMNYAAAAFALAGLCAIASCNKEQIVEGPVEPSSEEVELLIAAGEPGTKTTFTDPAAGDYSVKWEDETDKIGLFIADKTVNAEAGLTRKDGKAYFLSNVSGYEAGNTLYAYYPYAAAAEGETVAATAVKLEIPAAQTQKSGFNGSYNPMVAVPVELPASGTALEEPLKFRHLGAMVELKVKSAKAHVGESIKSVSFTAKDGGKVAGEFSFDITKVTETEALAEYAGSSETVTVALETPVAVSAEGASVFMTVIPGSYTGVFTVTTADNTYSYVSGYDYKRASVTRYTLDLDNAKELAGEIRTVADWEAFAAAVKAGADYSGKVVSLINDFSAENLSIATGTFNGKFAGNGHTITQTADTRPLFETLGENAEVTNLSLAGAFASFEKPYEWGNAALAKVNLGTVSNVTANCPAKIELTDAPCLFGSIVAQNGGTLQNCRNEGDVDLTIKITKVKTETRELEKNGNTVTVFVDKGAIANLGGGIAAYGHTIAGLSDKTGLYFANETCKAGKFIGCENKGNITIKGLGEEGVKGKFNGTEGLYALGVSTYGGICGTVELDGVEFQNCTNTGSISRVSVDEGSAQGSTCVGGILGRCAGTFGTEWGDTGAQICINVGKGYSLKMTGCTNSGTLFSSCRHWGGVGSENSGARHDNVGGIVGAVLGTDNNSSLISGCTNTGTVSGGWTANNVNTTVLGGVAGLAKNVKIEDCQSAGTLKNGDAANSCVGAAGGFVAYVIENVSVNKGSCTATFNLKKLSNSNLYWGLAFGNVKESATIGSASFGCAANIDGTALELSADNFGDYICNTGSNAKPTVTGCTWSK